MEPYVVGLAIWAFATSTLSAVIGMAGGMALLSAMLLFLDPLVAIPLHGVIQLVSNSTRTAIQKKHVQWKIVSHFAILLLPACLLGYNVARGLAPATGRTLIGLFVLVALWLPDQVWAGMGAAKVSDNSKFLGLGGIVGFLSVTVGATGPLIAPFFLRLGLTRYGIVGTKAACQTLSHLAKIAVFGLAGFGFRRHAVILVSLSVMTILGTAVGSRLLHRANDKYFGVVYRIVLTMIALHLVYRGLML